MDALLFNNVNKLALDEMLKTINVYFTSLVLTKFINEAIRGMAATIIHIHLFDCAIESNCEGGALVSTMPTSHPCIIRIDSTTASVP